MNPAGVRRMASNDGAAIPEALISSIYSILSDKDCVKLLQMISEHRQPKINDLGTRKRYYERITKLKKAHLIVKKKNKKESKEERIGIELTEFGSVVYESLVTLGHAGNLILNLKVIDELDKEIPHGELDKLMETLIPDEAIRKVLLQKNANLSRSL